MNKGIRFNSILPSTLIKPENVGFFTKDNEVRKMIEEITPLGRMGEAEDIANIVEFLCSSKASFLTGNSFMVDGGLSLIGQESIARSFGYHYGMKNNVRVNTISQSPTMTTAGSGVKGFNEFINF